MNANMSHSLAKADFLDISPTFNTRRPKDKENDASIPVLSLVQFSRSPFVTFGTLKLGRSKSLPLRVENPTEDAVITVSVDKIPSSRGFSIDQTSFTIHPEESVIVTVTWTPAEEGGVRELLSFVANGIVKHQAILLGKADAPKTKKKSLWDSIKSKKDHSKGGKVASVTVKAANKTFHVSRHSQYKKNRGSNPLTPLNHERASRRSIGSKEKNRRSGNSQLSQALPKSVCDNSKNKLQNNSPVVVLVPADQLLDGINIENNSFGLFADGKEIRILNKTLSPISTPQRFSNPLMPQFQSPLPVISKASKVGHNESGTMSIKDALAVIESDLAHAVSPPNACSSFNLPDSLESDCEPKTAVKAVANISDLAQPRLTFFVKSNKVHDSDVNALMSSTVFCPATADKQLAQKDPKTKKILFNCATVTKSKAEVSLERSPCTSKTKTSRRRLLQKPPPVSDLSSGSSTNLNKTCEQDIRPVINCDTDINLGFTITTTSPCYLQQLESPDQSFLVQNQTNPSPDEERNGNCVVSNGQSLGSRVLPSFASLDSSTHSCTANQNRKRKSEEFSQDNLSALSFEVKKSCAFRQQPKKPCPYKGFSSRPEKTQSKSKAAPSLKSTTVLPKKSKPKSTQQGGQSVKSYSTLKVKSAKVIAVAQSQLTFIKPTQSALPRHPLPFAAKNMFYDERWIEKQERGFTWWMNYVLTPDDFKVATEVTKVNALTLTMGGEKFNIPKAPTKEEMSFKTYTARRRLNRLRRAACNLFTTDSMAKAIKRLELEVESKRLLIRRDRHLWKDIGERQKVLNWLLSFNPLWLRIGLETIFGELISLESNSDVMGLAMFILTRLLWNPDIAADFRHPKVPHLYRDGHEETLSRFTLKKLLLLVCFLDKAKESRLIEHDPCLFCMDAEFKTSKDLLLAFSRDFLSGEGILSRHLSLLGLAVSHVQTPLDEFNYAVNNLATDLKCGIRLVRVMEIFTQDWSLSKKLRMPAVSRLQKVHNVNVAVQVLKEKGVDLKDEHGTIIEPKDVVDGHREKTLNLLWKIIFSFQVEVLLDVEELKEEISFLRKAWMTKQKLVSLRADKCSVKRTKVRTFENPNEKLTLLMDWVNAVGEFYGVMAENFTVSFSDGRILCYLIHHYHPNHLQAENIQKETTQTIECGTNGKLELNSSCSDSDYSFDSLEQNGLESPSVDFKALLENEKRNFELVSTAVSYLGGVPTMITPEDMSNTIPNEKVVTCYLSFLCARLLDLRNETRAARVIQNAWRRYKLKKEMQYNELRNQAAHKIQALVRTFLCKKRLNRQNIAATIIQAYWKGHSTRLQLKRIKEAKQLAIQNAAAVLIQAAFQKWHTRKMAQKSCAAVKIQSWYRMKRSQKHLALTFPAIYLQTWFRGRCQICKFHIMNKQHQSAITIQSAFRAYHVRKQIHDMKQAAVIIQRWYKACLLRNEEKRQYKEMKSAAIVLQAAFRGLKARKVIALQRHEECQRRIDQLHQCATIIQSHYRRHAAQRKFLCMKHAAVIIQRHYQAFLLAKEKRSEFLFVKKAAIVLQSAYRGMRVRQDMIKKCKAATVIQSAYRRHLQFLAQRRAAIIIQQHYRAYVLGQSEREHFVQFKKATVRLQAIYRGCNARRELKRRHHAATIIQAYFRMHKVQVFFLAVKGATTVIQQHYRAHVLTRHTRASYLQLKYAAVTIQSSFRGMKVRRSLQKMHQAATVIQACFRGHLQFAKYKRQKWASSVIQSQFRAYKMKNVVEKSYVAMKKSALCIQSAYRGIRVRKQISESHRAARIIQMSYRAHKQCKEYQALKQATILIQRVYKAKLVANQQRERFSSMRKAAITLQAAYRGMKVRREMQERHKAATAIQSAYRRHLQFLAQKRAAIIIQQHYRAYVLGQSERAHYVQFKKATVRLQAIYRGCNARRDLKRRHHAATIIQAYFRMHKVQVFFLAVKRATTVIQQHYRAHVLTRPTRASYLQLKYAAVTIQSSFRGMKVRRSLQKMHQAATVIQACFRGHLQFAKYKRQKWASSVIQSQFRAYKIKNMVEKSYVAMKKSALCIQSAYRGMRVRKQISESHRAARIIQMSYRAHKQCKEYQALKQATILIQRVYKAKLVANQQRERFSSMRKAAITLQAAYRGMKVRREMQARHKAATVIQAMYKMYRVRMPFQAMKIAVLLIQRRYRCYLKQKLAREHFLKLRHSAITIQAVFRGQQTRREIAAMHSAATLIKRRYLAYRDRKRFLSIKGAAKLCQQKYRANLCARQERKVYLMKRDAAIVIQAGYRRYKLRQQVEIEQKAAVIIQSHVRKYLQKSSYQRLQWAVRSLQRHYRANKMIKQEIKALQKKNTAVIVLQAAFHGMKARQTLALKHQAASIIQSAYRTHCAQTRYLCMKFAAIAIQRRYRSLLVARNQREQFLKLRCAAVTLQTYYRGHNVRRQIMLQHQASTLIQAAFRRHREVTKYQAMRLSVVIIQRHFRSYKKAKVARERYLTLRNSAIVLQAAFRGHSVRRSMTEMHKAATVIQAAVRMHIQRSAFKREQWAASVLQERVRAWKLGQKQRERYQQLKHAAICLQKSFRGKCGRKLVKQVKAARVIQSYVRMSIKRRRFLSSKAAAVVLQSAYRAHYCRVRYSRIQKSAVIIQQWYRSCKLVQKGQNDFKTIQKATRTLQCAFRRMLSRRHEKRRLAAITIQSLFRMHVHHICYEKLRSCAIKLQANYRMCTARRNYLRYQTAAVTVQRFYRAYRAKTNQRQHYITTLQHIRTLQAQVRGFIVYRRFQKMRLSAVTIQTHYRGLVEKRKFQHLKKCASVIQKHYRAYQLCQREQAQFLKIRRSTVVIQRQFRAYQSRKIYMQTQAAIKIQAWFRGCQARQRVQFQRIRKSAVYIQALWRGYRVRKAIQKEHNAAVVIQSSFRGYSQRRTFKLQSAAAVFLQRRYRAVRATKAEKEKQRKRNAAAITIQAFCRGWHTRQEIIKAARAAGCQRFAAAVFHHLCAVKIQRAMRAYWTLREAKKQISSVIYIQQTFRAKLQRKKYLEQRQKIIMVQKAVRLWFNRRNQAATVIQVVAKRFLLRRKKEKLNHGILKFQALWRGHQSRKNHDTSKLISIRHRVKKVNKEAKEEDKLCHKTSTALSYLLGYQNYAYILVALKHLETATRLSPECCERLVNSGATHILFTLIRSCNRSVPSMEIISLAIQVLLNLSKYNKTIDAVYEVENSVDTLLDLLHIYRDKAGDKVADKGGSIFTKTCLLLVILVQDKGRAMGVKKLPKAPERIGRIYKLTRQKYNMDVKRTKVKERMNVSLNSSFFPQATPQKSKPVVRFAPDWVLHRRKMNIVDPLGAIQMLVNTLALIS